MQRRYKVIALIVVLASVPFLFAGRKFHDDDPLVAEPAPRNADKILGRKFSDYYDFFYSSFGNPARRDSKSPVPKAGAITTLDEAIESSWWRQRHYYKPMTTEDLVRGPGNDNPPSMDGKWTVTSAKSEGITPGFTIKDSRGVLYFIKFDPKRYPEIATAPDVLVASLFHALGYNVPDNYIVEFDIDQLEIAEGTKLTDSLGKSREMTRRDVTEIMISVPRAKSGKFRAIASLGIRGQWAGPFRYWGTRKDDPNDVVPHEHRRDLRGLKVACAWVGHDDSRSINTVDFVDTENGVKFVKHYLIDFGSTLGSATDKPNSPRSGFEYLWEFKPAFVQFISLGMYVPVWARAHFPNLPSVGRFEHERFDAVEWRPEYPNPAFQNCRPDDGFWMAKQIMAITDDQIRAIVKTGQYSDPRAENWVTECLIKRKEKIGRAYFALLLPLDRFRVENGTLHFENLAVQHGFDKEPPYTVAWTNFDNERNAHREIRGATGLQIPDSGERYIAATIHGAEPKKQVVVYLRGSGRNREVVGIDRLW